jgi:hypothetical protein
MPFEIWLSDGRYIQGAMVGTRPTRGAAIVRAKKLLSGDHRPPISHERDHRNRAETWIEDDNHLPIGLIVKVP